MKPDRVEAHRARYRAMFEDEPAAASPTWGTVLLLAWLRFWPWIVMIASIGIVWGCLALSANAQIPTTSLVSVWEANEASGSLVDAFGSNTMTETSGTIPSITGKINGARDYEDGDTEYFAIASNAAVSMGDIDYTITCWVNGETYSGNNRIIIGKDMNSAGAREYNVFYRNLSSRFCFEAFSSGNSGTELVGTSSGAISTGTWYFIVAWYDATANTMNIQVNNGTVDSTSKGTLQASGAAPLQIGSRAYVGAESYFDGAIDQVTLWKRVLTTGERTALYNSGNGLAYANWNPSTARPQVILSQRLDRLKLQADSLAKYHVYALAP